MRKIINSSVLWTWVVTFLRLGGFFFVLPLVLRKIPSEELGMWYVFLSVAQFSAIVELGFAPNIARFASYFYGGASNPRAIGIDCFSNEECEPNLAGLAGLTQMGCGLYRNIGVAMGLFMTFGGGLWLHTHFGTKFWNFQVAPAFLLYAVGITVNMFGFFWIDLLFGVNRVRQGQQYFIIGLVINYIVCVIGLIAGLGLYALALGQVALALFPRWMAKRTVYKDFLSKAPEIQTVSWRDLWPMTWRSGLNTFAAWLSLPVMTLICAQIIGLRDTARYGLSLQLAMMLSGISGAWMAVVYPRVAIMRTRREFSQIRKLIAERFILTFATYVLGSLLAWWLAPEVLHLLKSRTDFLPPSLLAILLGVVCVDMLLGLCNAILFSGNHVPQLNSAVGTGGLAVGIAFLLGHYLGIVGIVIAPLCAQALFNIWYTPRLCWKDLHSRL